MCIDSRAFDVTVNGVYLLSILYSLYPTVDFPPVVSPLIAQEAMAREAIVIATRNRPDDLERTVLSIDRQSNAQERRLIVVDASNRAVFSQNRDLLNNASCPVDHLRYEGTPSAARQRNYGLDRLSSSIQYVFFLDDDISLHPDCLPRMVEMLREHPDIDGVGATEHAPTGASAPPSRSTIWRYAFLLDHPKPGRVLPSGHVSLYNSIPEANGITPVEWLSTCCCAYRRAAIHSMRFATNLGQALYEDRDFAYRVAQNGTLAVVPTAHYTHYFSPVNRHTAAQYARSRVCARYRFVEETVHHSLRQPAFWWATLGQLIALMASSNPSKHQALRGHLQGIKAVLSRLQLSASS